MALCIKCEGGEPDCFSSCDKCHIGLCDRCAKTFSKLLSELTKEKIKNCDLCRIDFYKFCDFCHNQTLTYMIDDKIKNYNDKKDLLRNCEKKWTELSEDLKMLIGEPNEYLKTNWNYCDCDDLGHCNRIAQEELKQELGIQHFSLYERGLDYLLCKTCYLKEFNQEPNCQCY